MNLHGTNTVKTLEDKLVIYTGLNNDLRADKENLRKQLELVTLILPNAQTWLLGPAVWWKKE
jgi:ABC-type uncharacterized transport system substrate-binding protein